MFHKQYHHGQSLGEYGLVGALIILAAIPAILLLGNTLNTNFGNTIPGANSLPGKALVAGPTTGKLSGSPSNAQYNPETGRIINTSKIYIDANGQALITFPDGYGAMGASSLGETATAGVQGDISETSRYLAGSMERLIEQWEKANGEILDPQLSAMLQQMADIGRSIAEEENRLEIENSWWKTVTDEYGNVLRDANGKKIAINDTEALRTLTNNLASAYNEFEATLSGMQTTDSAKYQSLKDNVDIYSGLISKMSADRYLSFDHNITNGGGYVNYAGSPPDQTINTPEVPKITNETAGSIEQLK